ncbi:hypothetical protein BN381_130037 [Candidatus Microthrix parvicella RN1]|uniref:Uncharacterized protein n=1 Tax=Candidatus Neomicrothrix parvicella RN1 TaxID=1229780 RepID=R4YWD8_9ACTN|nr:hypothetical protein BN381_130037 [Candidatus Microthrix parvicella RN1]
MPPLFAARHLRELALVIDECQF